MVSVYPLGDLRTLCSSECWSAFTAALYATSADCVANWQVLRSFQQWSTILSTKLKIYDRCCRCEDHDPFD